MNCFKPESILHVSELTKDKIQIRDPFVIKHDNSYYLFGSTDKDIWSDGSGTGFDCYIGNDLEIWKGPYPAFRAKEGFWGKDNFWAPEVYSYQGAFYMFASFRGENKMRGTAILKANHPLGPYEEWSKGVVTPDDWMSLDGTLFVDNENQPWMVFCHEWVQIQDGTICALKLTPDLKAAIGEPIELFKSTDAPWSKAVESKRLKLCGWVTDGCYLYTMRNGKLLMLWSCIGEQGYCIGYAISDNGSLLGPWKQSKQPLYEKDGGHGMIFEAFDGRLLLSIHCPNTTPNERAMFIELTETESGVTCIPK